MMRRDWLWIGLLALGLNAGVAYLLPHPNSMDAYYYFGGAMQLARGHGFTEPYLWNYLAPLGSLPAPSHLYWMPLSSMVAAPFIALMEMVAGRRLPGDMLFRAAQIPMVLLASALPVLTYRVAQHVTPLRRHAIAAALLTLFSAFYVPFWTNTDSFALFGVLAAAAFLLYALGVRPAPLGLRRTSLLAAGLLSGLAHLARADGVLIIVCLVLFDSATQLRSTWGSERSAVSSQQSAISLPRSAFLLGGYFLVTAPWFLRNLMVVGAPLAPGGARTLWLTHYNDLFTYAPEQLTLARYLAQGWASIARDKWEALSLNLQTLVATQANIIAFPFAIVGGWKLRGNRLMQLAWLYGALLFGVMTFAFTFPGPRGGYFHSGAAMIPFIAVAAIVGLDASVEAVASRLKHWQPERSKPIFTTLLVLGAALLTAFRVIGAAAAASTRPDAVYAEIGAWLQSHGAGAATVMVNNPPGFHYHTGLAAIVVPSDEAEVLLRAMNDHRARWLVLEYNVAPALVPLYNAPSAEPRLSLRATFHDGLGREVYLLELAR